MMLGEIKFVESDLVKKPPQRVASALSATENLTGASYRVLQYLGDQPSKGTNYWFFAEQILITNPVKKRMVVFAVNGFQNHYSIIPSSIEEVKFEI